MIDTVERTAKYMSERRRKSLEMAERVNKKAHSHALTDTNGVMREPIHVGPQSAAFKVSGDLGDKSNIIETVFSKVVMLLEGAARFTFEDGRVEELNNKNDIVPIPSGVKYLVEALQKDTVVILKLKDED